MKKIGLLGGSFDPPHRGHLFISNEAKKVLQLDEIWWLVTPQNPLKISKPATYEERLQNCKQITKNFPIKILEVEKKIKSQLSYLSILSALILGILFFPSTDFQTSILVGNLLPIDFFSSIITTNLLFISFTIPIIAQILFIAFYSLRSSFK